ncbi:MAG: hypothetical protein U5L09_18865 [Bacteroidales bacterium]|nr:hypothetical protein [Bacteroidales bacterium]
MRTNLIASFRAHNIDTHVYDVQQWQKSKNGAGFPGKAGDAPGTLR